MLTELRKRTDLTVSIFTKKLKAILNTQSKMDNLIDKFLKQTKRDYQPSVSLSMLVIPFSLF